MSEKKPPEHRISAIPPFGLRMLPELRAKVEEAAAANGRSMNAEIVSRLEWSFDAGVIEEAGTDISRAMTWGDHTQSMSAIIEQAAATIRTLTNDVTAMRFEMAALRHIADSKLKPD